MKKLILVPVVAVAAAAAAASAAGLTVSSGPLQSGSTTGLRCADSAKVVEWGANDHLPTPNVVNARIELTGSNCAGQALHFITLNPDGSEQYRASSGRIAAQAPGTQYARVTFPAGVNATVASVDAFRITIDPGYAGMTDLPTA